MPLSIGRIIAAAVILLVLVSLLGPCQSTGPPTDARNMARQIELINQSFDALEEEVTAAQAPSHGPFLIFILSVLLPMGAAFWLIWRAECSAVHHDQVLRAMVQLGFEEPLINTYVRRIPDQLPGPNLPFIRRAVARKSHHKHRRRRKWRRKLDSEDPNSESDSRLKHIKVYIGEPTHAET
jgi:hypothetical protein